MGSSVERASHHAFYFERNLRLELESVYTDVGCASASEAVPVSHLTTHSANLLNRRHGLDREIGVALRKRDIGSIIDQRVNVCVCTHL